ncbi:MAG: glycosyl hydrolase family 8 [Bacteroidales bacterium]|nr:glycosyl hydrolase family 8 [Bacteroidales bacterium]
MKKYLVNVLALVISVVMCNGAFAAGGINTGKGKIPFGSNTQYNYGIMPTNLPSSGTYGGSQKAAEAYDAWKNKYVGSCSPGYRVKFDDESITVSEGIAYGMLLSVYADDRDLFDGLWTYYKNHRNGNGVMNWKISGCGSATGDGQNGATDAELDVAMSLVIASEQWGGSYGDDAKAFIQVIKKTEMGSDGQTLNGDAWGNTNTCRNPSYFAPGYYAEFAKVDTDNGTFWGTTAIAASDKVLKANMNQTSGLVSNWCDNNGSENTCGNTGSGAQGYGADACRNPWRMTIDYLWHGPSCSAGATAINAKLIKFVSGYENQLKGPFSNRNVSNPGSGSYVNGSYTTLALPTMTSKDAQSSLNKCYAAVASLGDVDVYFNTTIRCITLFVMTGNFWSPGASGFVFPPSVSSSAVTGNKDDGYKLTLTMSKTMSAGTSAASNFTLYYNGAEQNAISKVTVNSDKTVVLTLSAGPQPGQTVVLSYNGNGNIKSSDDAVLASFTKIEVLNMVDGSETILDDCEDGNEFNNVGGIWFTFNDTPDQESAAKPGTKSSITPLTGKENPLEMETTGFDGTGYAVHAKYKLGSNYTPYNNGAAASWTNPAYVGIGTWVDDVETSSMDWSGGDGVTFWYKGPKCMFQIIISEVTDYCFHKYDVPECSDWTKITVKWGDLAQPTWGTAINFSAKHVLKLQWQFSTDYESSGASGDIWIDEVHILGMPPVALTGLEISPVSDADLEDDDCAANIDPLKIPIASKQKGDTLYLETTATPEDASYPVVFWSSSDEEVVTVDYKGRVIGVGYGEATITARSKMHQNISTTYTVKVPAPAVKPTAIAFEEDAYEVGVGETATIIPRFSPSGVTETGLTWKSSDVTKATVSASGVVTGISAGEVTVTATSSAEGCSSVKNSVTVTVVKKEIALKSISASDEPVELPVGLNKEISLTFDPADATNKSVTWSSSKESVATVTDGVITAVAAGTCTITATSEADPSIKAEIAVTVADICVTEFTLEESSINVDVDSEEEIYVKVKDYKTNYETTPKFTYTSSDKDVVRVDSKGLLTIRGDGTATITVTASDNCELSKECEVTVSSSVVPVTGVELDKSTETVSVGEKVTLKAIVSPSDATDKSVTWSSSKESVATVVDGVVTAVDAGEAVITVTTKDGGETATCTITVTKPVSGVTLSETSKTLVKDETLDLVATVAPADASNTAVEWTSSDAAIATVNGSGKVTAKAKGKATITVTTLDGAKTASCEITVIVVPTSITMDQALNFVDGDDAKTLTATVLPSDANNQNIIWSSDDQNVATVVDGVVTPVGEGNCIITAKCEADETISATCKVTVSASTIAVTGVSLNKNTLTITAGEEATLSAVIAPEGATNTKITWASSKETVATVENGIISAIAPGETVITVTTEDGGFTASCTVTVEAATISVTGVDLDKTALSLYVDESETLKASVKPADASNTKVAWSSSNPAVATVDQSGKVEAISAGDAIITVTTEDGEFTKTCKVTVENLPEEVVVTAVELNSKTLTLKVGTGQSLIATVKYSDGTSSKNEVITWSTDNAAVADVDDGYVTGASTGKAEITASFKGKSATCVVTVESDVTVSAIELSLTELQMEIGDEKGLKATVKYSDGTSSTKEKNIVWESDNESVVGVDDGWLIAVEEGEATITASIGSVSATCVVTVGAAVIPVTSVTLNKTNVSITKTESVTLLATIMPTTATNKAVTWSSSRESVATVIDGKIIVVGVGTTIITVTTEDGSKTATCELTVTDILVEMVIIDNSLSLTVGESDKISVTVLPTGASNNVKWASSNEKVATVDEDGNVTAVSAGSAEITATSADGSNITSEPCVVTVSNVKVTDVELDKESLIVRVGATVTLNATVSPAAATNKTVKWSSSKTTASVVDGVVTGVSAGSTTITAASDEDSYIKATCSVDVVDASELNAEISSATASLNSAVEGTEIGQYKAGSKATLQSAIAKAQTVYDNENATQTAIDRALSDLQAAVNTFSRSINANETLIFDADLKQENMTYMATYWFSFDDNTASADPEKCGSSVITPKSTEDEPFTMSESGYNGSGKAAMMQYTLEGSKALGYSPFVGMGMNFAETVGKPFDMTGSTGISFWMKNESRVYFEVELTGITDACDYYIYLPANNEWHLVELAWSDLDQYTWGTQVDWDLTQLTKCQWKVQEPDGETGKVWVDEVKIMGTSLNLPEIDFGEEIDLSALATKIEEATDYYTNSEEGNEEGKYLSGSKATLNKAITSAQSVYDSAETQDEVDAATTALDAAIEEFLSSKYIPGVVNKSVLTATIESANTLYKSAVEGGNKGEYPSDSKTELYSAITEAQKTKASSSATQDDVDAAVAVLQAAIDDFKAKVITVDKSVLNATITAANTALAKADGNTGEEPGQYPASAVATLTAAISDAVAIQGNSAVKQVVVDAAVSSLEDAIKEFNASVIPGGVDIEELVKLIEEADDLINNTFDPNKYLMTYIELVNCKSSAKTEVAKQKHSADDVETITKRLSAAIEAFRAAKEKNPEEIEDAIDDVNAVSISAYPNPCKNMIQITAGKEVASVTVVNLTGATQFVVEASGNEIIINVSQIKAGIYFAYVSYVDGSIETIRFVKQ